MESRKRLYKATSVTSTLSERVNKGRSRQNETRKDRFNSNRNIINLDDSLQTPTKPAPVKLSQIKDKPARLRAYIEQKRTTKLKEQLEQRSPFVPYVPVGRYVERKETARKPKAFTISTPVRKALMSDGKIFKKSTIKEIATTAKKENLGTVKKIKQPEPVKSRKKILVEINAFVAAEPKKEEESPEKLNETFELLSSDNEDADGKNSVENPAEKSPVENQVISMVKSPVEDIRIPLPLIKEQETVQKVEITRKQNVDAVKSAKAAKQKKSQATKKPTAKIAVPVKRPREIVAEAKVAKKQTLKKAASTVQKQTVLTAEPSAVPSPPKSQTYQFYKQSLDNQNRYITIQLKSITSNMDNFIEKLPEEAQTTVHQTIQQGRLLINEKFKNFEDIVEKFENTDKSDPKRITVDDLENYWMLLYEQVQKFKDNLQYAQEAKTFAMKNDKRRTRKTLSETPSRRSRRIAESSGTPKHNSSICLACTPISSSKVNTPRSAKKKRATFKKSIAFDLTSEN